MANMSDNELRGILSAQHESALGHASSSRISERRVTALQNYRGEPMGDEVDGRSKVISMDVFDVVESTLPSLLKIFAGTDRIAEFEAVGPEDEPQAHQATDYINYVFLNDNQGFNVLSTWFKDALLQINGFVKVYWEERETWVDKRYQGLTQEQIPLLLKPEEEGQEYVITEQQQRMVTLDDGQQIPVFDLRLKCKKIKKTARVIPVAPEDVGVAAGTLDLDEAHYSYHRCEKTVSDLLEMGHDKNDVMDAAGYGEGREDYERTVRSQFEEDFPAMDGADPDPSMRPVVVTEHYIRLDYDGDGIAEYRKITTAGETHGIILDNEELAENPLAMITPIQLPHQTFGLALAEVARPIQEVKTTLQRQMLDNFYRTNSSRLLLNQNLCTENTIQDILNDIPGGVIRANGEGAVKPLPVQSLGQEPFTMLEYQDSLLEQRTGVTRYNQGLDADSLNKTATGIQMIQGASQERLMLIARYFGDGVKRMFGKLLRLTIRHQDVARTFRLRNKWITVDPREWDAEMDVNISVGLGTGSKDQMLAHLTALMDRQVTQLLPLGIVQPQHVLHTAGKLVENMGFKNTEAFVPTEEEYQQIQAQQAQQPPQQDPATVQAQQKMQMDQQKMEMDGQAQDKKLQFEQEKAAAEHIQRDKHHQDSLASQERMHAAKLESESQSKREIGEMTAKAAEKPTAMLQVDAQGAMEQVAATLQAMAQDQSTAMQAALEGIAMASQAIAAAVAQMNAPKSVSMVLPSGKQASGLVQTVQ